jgi:hypothetical protein
LGLRGDCRRELEVPDPSSSEGPSLSMFGAIVDDCDSVVQCRSFTSFITSWCAHSSLVQLPCADGIGINVVFEFAGSIASNDTTGLLPMS